MRLTSLQADVALLTLFRSAIVRRRHGAALVRDAYRIPKWGAAPLGKQQTPHLPLRTVKLRLRGVDGEVQQFGDLAMLIPLNFVKTKDLSVT